MKKFLLCMMLAGLMMPAIAQEKSALKQNEKGVVHVSQMRDVGGSTQEMLPVNTRGALVDVGLWESAGVSESYDRQAQRSVYPMTKKHDDGFIGCTWTNNDNPVFDGSGTPLRGVGYSYSTDDGETWSEQENRLGGIPLYWPSYAQWGPHGEAVLARSADTYTYMNGDEGIEILNGLVLLTRETKGEGEWNIVAVPYPEGTSDADGYVMAWARMTTSGPNHQYIHIMSPMSTEAGQPYKEYREPVFYYRTQDGGVTWDAEALLVPEMVGQIWDYDAGYFDAISFAVRGNIVACSFITFGASDAYVLKSLDNGDTWNCTSFFHSDVSYSGDISVSIDSVYVPSQGCIALDSEGKIHVVFGVSEATNNEQEGYITYFSGLLTSFLSYWNEDMPPIDGNATFTNIALDDMLFEDYFDLDNSEDGQFYVNSTVPQWPVIGYYTPIGNDNFFNVNVDILRSWMGASYNIAGQFSFPQIAFDANDILHVTYLGVLDAGNDGAERWKRHPFYTTTADGGETWTQTEYLVNFVSVIDQEFAYLTLAGITASNKMLLMAQTDPFAGVFEKYAGDDAPDHSAVKNTFYFFSIEGVIPPPPPPPGITENTVLPMQLLPNPASGQVRVAFEGKGNITVYNMLGQTVYHVENVEKQKDIPLNMASGVYFVTVRSGNATATQKLIVK